MLFLPHLLMEARRPQARFYAAQVTIYVPLLMEEEGYYVQKRAAGDGQTERT